MAARQRFRGRIAGVGSTSGVRVVVGWWHESPFGPFADAMVERADGHRVLLAPTAEVRDLVAGTYVFDETRIEPVSVTLGPTPGAGCSAGRRGSHLSTQPWSGSEPSVDPSPPLSPSPSPSPSPLSSPSPSPPSSPSPSLSLPRPPSPSPSPSPSLTLTSPSLSLSLEVGDRMPLGRLLRLVPGALAESPAWATVVDPVARVVLRGVRTRGVARAGRREYYGATDVHAVTALTGSFDGIPLGDLRPVDPPCRFGFSSTPRSPSVTDVVTTIVES